MPKFEQPKSSKSKTFLSLASFVDTTIIPTTMNTIRFVVTVVLGLHAHPSIAFFPLCRTPHVKSSSRVWIERDKDGNIKKGLVEYILDPKPTKIPPELKEEIYKAESNTEAAKQRQFRVIGYSAVAVVLVAFGFLNVFLTELRSATEQEAGSRISLDSLGWGWVESNGFFNFMLSTKIGGALGIMGGASSAMLVEAEMDSQRQNAEKIYEELERRRSEKLNRLPRKKKQKTSTPTQSKRKQSGSQKKRLAALSEVVDDDEESVTEGNETMEQSEEQEDAQKVTQEEGLMGKLKELYEKADSMAASQALLLNKELEDRGVIEKITDESGLKVIGKEAAAKLVEEKKDNI
jgi:hypothetical protein